MRAEAEDHDGRKSPCENWELPKELMHGGGLQGGNC
jgi:hypothetical protein